VRMIRNMTAACAAFVVVGMCAGTAAAQAQTAPRQGKNELSVGTGVLGYFSGSGPGTGGAWEARYGYTFIPLLTVEGQYTGGASDSPGPGAAIATMIEANARVNFLRGSRFNPFVLAGAGWGAFNITGPGQSDTSTFLLPLGAGASVALTDRWDLGGRFVYHIAFGDTVGPLRANADNYTLTALAGTTF
jgi:opacity protein-like surface antigen